MAVERLVSRTGTSLLDILTFDPRVTEQRSRRRGRGRQVPGGRGDWLSLDLHHRRRDGEWRPRAQLEVGVRLDLAQRRGLLGQREQVEAGRGRGGLWSEVYWRQRVRGEEAGRGYIGDVTQVPPDTQ